MVRTEKQKEEEETQEKCDEKKIPLELMKNLSNFFFSFVDVNKGEIIYVRRKMKPNESPWQRRRTTEYLSVCAHKIKSR